MYVTPRTRGGWTSTCMAGHARVWENSEMQFFFSARSSEVKVIMSNFKQPLLCEGHRSVRSSSVDRASYFIYSCLGP